MVKFENNRLIIEAEPSDRIEELVGWQGALINVCMNPAVEPEISACLMQLLNILMPDYDQQKRAFGSPV